MSRQSRTPRAPSSPKTLDAVAHQRAEGRLDFISSSKEWLSRQDIHVCIPGSAANFSKVRFGLASTEPGKRRTVDCAGEKALTCRKVPSLCLDYATCTTLSVRANTGKLWDLRTWRHRRGPFPDRWCLKGVGVQRWRLFFRLQEHPG